MSDDTLNLLAVEHDPFAGPALVAVAPITEPQREVWLACQLHEDASLSYNEASEITLRGPLDVERLRRCWQHIVQRHEILRASFSPDGEWICVEAERPLDIACTDLRAVPDAAQQLSQARREEVLRRFDLERGALLAVRVFQLADEEHRVLFTAHHIIVDGWSAAEIYKDFARLYEQDAGLGPAAAPSYCRFAREERRWQDSAEGQRTQDYWRGQFADGVPDFELPLDYPRRAERSFAGNRVDHRFDPALVASLRKLGAAQGTSLVNLTLAAFAVLLQRLSGAEDLVIGLAAAAQSYLGETGLVGHAVNVLPLRLKPRREQRFCDFLQQARTVLLDGFDHQRFTFGSLVQQLKLQREPGKAPLVPVVFNIDVRNDPISPAGLSVSYRTLVREFENFELFVNAVDDGHTLSFECSYNTALFRAGTLRAWMLSLQALLESVIQDPAQALGRVPMMSPAQRRALLAGPALATPPLRLLHEWFAETAERHAQRPALSCEGVTLSYAEVERRANRLAQVLVAHGVAAGDLVGVFLDRRLELPIALLAVLKTGAAYLPMDPVYPADRLAHMVSDSACCLVLTESALREQLPAEARVLLLEEAEREAATAPDVAPQASLTPDARIYVIYTSGSTGKPKGCELTHANVSRLFSSTRPWYGFNEHDVWPLFHSAAFDVSVWELWGAWLHGGRLVVVPYWVSRESEQFHALVAKEGVTVLNQTPSAFRQFQAADLACEPPRPLALRRVIFAGEALEFQSLRPWFERHGDEQPRLINMYGITETTVHVTWREVRLADLDGEHAPSLIGVPIPDLSLAVLDADGEPTPPGVRGELWVGGAGVARGYLNRPELNAARFVQSPHHPGLRLYRSGDLARWLADEQGAPGELEYLGRMDHQVKLRGFRIELGEIEAQVNRHAAVAGSFVNILEDQPGDPRLVAWLVPREGTAAPAAYELREHLRGSLPAYMIPQHFVTLERFPLTANGKLDRRALPSPFAGAAERLTKAPPQTATEQAVRDLWAEVLGVSDIGVDDRFFDLGGHSLLAVRTAARLQKERGVKLPLRVVMMESLRVLAATLDQLSPPPSAAAAAPGETPPVAARLSASPPAEAPATGLAARIRRWFKAD